MRLFLPGQLIDCKLLRWKDEAVGYWLLCHKTGMASKEISHNMTVVNNTAGGSGTSIVWLISPVRHWCITYRPYSLLWQSFTACKHNENPSRSCRAISQLFQEEDGGRFYMNRNIFGTINFHMVQGENIDSF